MRDSGWGFAIRDPGSGMRDERFDMLSAMRLWAVSTLFVGAVAMLVASSQQSRATRASSLEPPGRDEQAHIDGDTAILPNGRRVTPAGRVIRTQSYGWGLAVTPDGRRAALVHPDAIELVDLVAPYAVRRGPPASWRG